MRAAIVNEIGKPPSPGEWPEPERGESEALIQVTGAALNPVDLSTAAGRFYGGVPEVPYVAGSEGSGTVLEGERLERGTRVRFNVGGSLAERVVAPEAELFDVPRGMDDKLAAALGTAGLTAWLALEWRALLQQGETVLVLGATGAVGRFAVQSAKALGAGRVVAAARDAEQLETVKEQGADATVTIGHGEDDARAMREACGDDGPDVVIDPLWGEPARAASEAAARRARFVQVGQTAGPEATLTSNAVRGKMLSILGFALPQLPFELKRDAWTRLTEEVAAGRVTIDVEEIPLDGIAEAWERQERYPHRKLVVVP
jgi:NADPH:quinone reductase-like Zn-dependent oxidoreductase